MTKKWRQYNDSKVIFSTNCAGTAGHPHLDTDFALFTKIGSKWVTDLNEKRKSIKLLEDDVENLSDLQYGDDLATTPKAQSVKHFALLPQPQLLALGVGKRDCTCSVATRGTEGKEDNFVDA